ncbi:type II toxin-antitoxin system RelE/ParE family toxin [Rhizobium oryzihabitans]|uniref:type II toxin-antitoxin system RelE/ParE family toxin n=1 Tax=Rhizobium oryzihabitans TaxID=2267833 RepID=UPI003CCD9E43
MRRSCPYPCCLKCSGIACRTEPTSLQATPLKGTLKGHWSIWVNGNWRVTFRFVGADVELVDYVDYH